MALKIACNASRSRPGGAAIATHRRGVISPFFLSRANQAVTACRYRTIAIASVHRETDVFQGTQKDHTEVVFLPTCRARMVK
jgi:hypothetical protein